MFISSHFWLFLLRGGGKGGEGRQLSRLRFHREGLPATPPTRPPAQWGAFLAGARERRREAALSRAWWAAAEASRVPPASSPLTHPCSSTPPPPPGGSGRAATGGGGAAAATPRPAALLPPPPERFFRMPLTGLPEADDFASMARSSTALSPARTAHARPCGPAQQEEQPVSSQAGAWLAPEGLV